MKHARGLLVLALTLAMSAGVSNAATIKPNAPCKKLGVRAVQGGLQYTCVRMNGKLVWSKGKRVVAPTPAASSTPSPAKPNTIEWTSPCQRDPGAGTQWRELQDWLWSKRICERPMRVVDVPLSSVKPTSSISGVDAMLPVQRCKVPDNPAKQFFEGFPSPADTERFLARAHPGPNTVYQVVPITSPDAPTRGRTPEQDYGRYFDFITAWTKSASDTGSKVELRVPKDYLPFSQRVGPYGVDHHADAASRALGTAILSEVDGAIDFSGVNLAIVVVPAGTPQSVLWQGQGGDLLTSEGARVAFMFVPPYTFDDSYAAQFRAMPQPSFWVHELYHARGVLDDHLGAERYGDASSDNGTGNWGLMSGSITDHLGWEKWLLGFWSDTQIRCAPMGAATTSWLIPSGVQSQSPKLAVVRLSQTKALIAESIRAVGFNFKLPKSAQGLLVYTLDTSDTRRDHGFRVLWADGEAYERGVFEYSNAPLGVGQHVTVDDVRLTVVEAGDFGDVVRIEPAPTR